MSCDNAQGNTLRAMARTALAGASVWLLVACGSVQVGCDFDINAFEPRVQRGATTQAQVRSWLGAPNSTGFEVDAQGVRNEEWTYFYGQGQLSGTSDAKFKMLKVRYDTQGRVLSYSWSGEPR